MCAATRRPTPHTNKQLLTHLQGDVVSGELVSPPPVAELSWDSFNSDANDDDVNDLPPLPDLSTLDPSLFDDAPGDTSENSLESSPPLNAAASHAARRPSASFTAVQASPPLAAASHDLVTKQNPPTDSSAGAPTAQHASSAPAAAPLQPQHSDIVKPTASKKVNKRGSVFTIAAQQLMHDNPDHFKPVAAEIQPVSKVENSRAVIQEAREDEPEMLTELDWSPGSEFVKFASISTLPSLKIGVEPTITADFMAKLIQYKSEFIAAIFTSATNHNRSNRMCIFTGRQFVEFFLSDSCSAGLRLGERGSVVGIGKLMCLYDLIHEVEDEHDFEDLDSLKYDELPTCCQLLPYC